MADAFNILKWDNTAGIPITGYGSSTGYVTFKDEDGGEPGRIKRLYGARMTYRIGGSVAKSTGVTYALDGATSFVNTYIPTSYLNNAPTTWNKDDVMFSTYQSAQSWRFKVTFGVSVAVAGIYELNDFSVEARPIYRRVT
jgi:hypothetical protein